jgi:predicted AAA+ superfamily ATPase
MVKMPKVFLLDTGLRNCLLSNFQPLVVRGDKGELWENTVFRTLVEIVGTDDIQFWRTTGGNEIDFILTESDPVKAIEVKYDLNQVKKKKYKLFAEAYPEIQLQFFWLNPFGPDFFRRIYRNIR